MTACLKRLAVVVVLPWIMVQCGEPGTVEDPQPAMCSEVALESPPRWLASGVYHAGWEGPMMVDPLRDAVIVYGEDGAVKGGLKRCRECSGFGAVTRWPRGGYLLKLAGVEFVVLDEALEVQHWSDLEQTTRSEAGRLVGLYGWTVAGTDVVGYGVYLDEELKFGFVRIDLEQLLESGMEGDRRVEAEMLYELEDFEYYSTFAPLFASVGSTAYYVELVSEAEPVVYRCAPESACSRLVGVGELSSDLVQAPVVEPEDLSFSAAEGFYARVEEMSVPVGLYGWDGTLYLLVRRPKAVGTGTRWTLFGLDPETGHVVGEPWELPLDDAHHLGVIPGRSHWYFVLFGSLRLSFREQPVGMRMIDSTVFQPEEGLRDLNDIDCAPRLRPVGQ